jgi:hypothetical protein
MAQHLTPHILLVQVYTYISNLAHTAASTPPAVPSLLPSGFFKDNTHRHTDTQTRTNAYTHTHTHLSAHSSLKAACSCERVPELILDRRDSERYSDYLLYLHFSLLVLLVQKYKYCYRADS